MAFRFAWSGTARRQLFTLHLRMKAAREKSSGKSSKARRRNRIFTMAHLKQAALGFRVHSGWTALVAVCLEKGAPVVLARQRVHLVETFSYEFRQPYHTAEKMLTRQARDFIERVRDEARRLAHRAILAVQSDLEKQGIGLKSCGLLLASGRTLPTLDKILASHALIHTAERELLDSAGQVFGLKSAALMSRVTELGRSFGAPWSQDEKFATLAAWLALAAPSKNNSKAGEKSAAS